MKKLLSSLLLSTSLFAHPHLFLDIYPTINVKDKKVESLDLKWVLDEMSSNLVLLDFDLNKDGKFSKIEKKIVKKSYFKDFQDYSFYLDINTLEKGFTYKDIKNFDVKTDGLKVVITFSVDINKNAKDLKLSFYDEDFFAATILKKEFVTSKNPFKITEIDSDFYFGYALELKW